MIQTFGDVATEDFYHGRASKAAARFKSAGIDKALQKRLDQLNAASVLSDMSVPRGNDLHALDGDLAGFHAVKVNKQYRLVFKFTDGHAYDVRCYDYH